MSAAKNHRHQDNRCAHEVRYVVGIVLGAILTLLSERSQDGDKNYRRYHLRLVHQPGRKCIQIGIR
jgi:hypothetical protein